MFKIRHHNPNITVSYKDHMFCCSTKHVWSLVVQHLCDKFKSGWHSERNLFSFLLSNSNSNIYFELRFIFYKGGYRINQWARWAFLWRGTTSANLWMMMVLSPWGGGRSWRFPYAWCFCSVVWRRSKISDVALFPWKWKIKRKKDGREWLENNLKIWRKST